MFTPSFRAERLARHHRREDFACGVDVLDHYLKEQATQDARRGLAVPYVLTDTATGAIAGFYTLSNFTVDPTKLPDAERKRAGRYFVIPAIIIGRLARDGQYRGQGVGELLLIDAFRRSWVHSQRIGTWAIVVDAKEGARVFYERYGFAQFVDDSDRLFIPIRTVEHLLRIRFGDAGLKALAESAI